MEYDGMTAEVVARGINAGSNGATSIAASVPGAGAAAGADFFFLVALFLDFLADAAATAGKANNTAARRTHAMTGM